MRFPRELTLKLPALQREALEEIQKREPEKGVTDLLEHLLAMGIVQKLAEYADDPGAASAPSPAPDVEPPALPEDLQLHLDADLRTRLGRAMKGHPPFTNDDFVLWLLEWGLENYEEGLEVISEQPDTSGGSP